MKGHRVGCTATSWGGGGRTIAKAMADEQFLAFLTGTPFFAALEGPALALVGSMLLPRTWPAGATIFHEGDQGNSLYLVKRGTLVVYQRGPPGEPLVKLTRLGPGDLFGEMTLIEMQPRSASGLRRPTSSPRPPAPTPRLAESMRRQSATRPRPAATLPRPPAFLPRPPG